MRIKERALRRIIRESLDEDFDEDWYKSKSRLSEKQKRTLFGEMRRFDRYGESIYRDQNLVDLAERFEALVEYASRYLNETNSSFDRITINRNIRELSKYINKFKKTAKDVQEKQERLESLYEDIGVLFDRYFDVGTKNLED
jgi:hypothetical protein